MTAVLLANHRVVAPFGLSGGHPGATGRNWIERVDGSVEQFGATHSAEVNAGDVFVIQTPAEAALAEQPRTARLATASIVGTMLEYYDFAIYNTLAALAFNRLFFPSFEPLTGTILAFSTFAVGYFSRPIGGVIFGTSAIATGSVSCS